MILKRVYVEIFRIQQSFTDFTLYKNEMYLDNFRRKKYFIHIYIYKKYLLVNLRKKGKKATPQEYIRSALLVNEVSE